MLYASWVLLTQHVGRRAVGRCILAMLLVALYVSAHEGLAAPDLFSDERLRKPVNLQREMALLSEALQSITDDTGVAFTLAPELSEQKVTIFVKGKPASEVLTKIISLFKLECQQSGDGYILKLSEDAVRLERDLILRETSLIRSAAQNTLNRWAQYARQHLTYWKQRTDQIQQEMELLARRQPPNWQDRRARLAEELAGTEEAANPIYYLAGKIYGMMSPTIQQRFWSGEMLLFCTQDLPSALLLPPEAPSWLDNGTNRLLCFLMRYSPQQERIVLARVTLPSEEATKPDIDIREVDIIPAQGDEHPLQRQWQKWATPREVLGQIPKLQCRMATTPSAQAGREHISSKQALTVADHLQWLAEHSELSVIADAYRLPAFSDKPLFATTVAEWIERFIQVQGGYLRIEGDYLLYRHPNYWRLSLSEIPEKLVRQYEHKARNEGLNLEDYASLALQLQPHQQIRLQQARGYAVGFDVSPLSSALPALRFWASLSANQKEIALQRQPLYYLQLSPLQQSLFWQALQDSIASSSDVAWMLQLLSNPETAQNLAFLLERWQQTGYTASAQDVTITAESREELRQQLPVADGHIGSVLTKQFRLYFGFASDKAVIYSLAIP